MRSDVLLWLQSLDLVVVVVGGFSALVVFNLAFGYVSDVLARRAWFGRRLDRW